MIGFQLVSCLSKKDSPMPAVTADTLTLTRISNPGAEITDRPVRSVTTAPSGFEGEGFPVRRAFAGIAKKYS